MYSNEEAKLKEAEVWLALALDRRLTVRSVVSNPPKDPKS
jgi:hypothetical protein